MTLHSASDAHRERLRVLSQRNPHRWLWVIGLTVSLVLAWAMVQRAQNPFACDGGDQPLGSVGLCAPVPTPAEITRIDEGVGTDTEPGFDRFVLISTPLGKELETVSTFVTSQHDIELIPRTANPDWIKASGLLTLDGKDLAVTVGTVTGLESVWQHSIPVTESSLGIAAISLTVTGVGVLWWQWYLLGVLLVVSTAFLIVDLAQVRKTTTRRRSSVR